MTLWERTRFITAIVAQAIAVVFISGSVYFFVQYYADIGNPLRHEYIVGVSLTLLYALGFTLASALVSTTLKKVISRWQFRILAWPALALGIGFLSFYFGSIVFDLTTRT